MLDCKPLVPLPALEKVQPPAVGATSTSTSTIGGGSGDERGGGSECGMADDLSEVNVWAAQAWNRYADLS